MTELAPIFLLIASGALIASQATMNASLGRSLGIPLFTVVFTVVQLVFTFPVLLGWGWPVRWSSLGTTPAWQYIGGALGVPILCMMAFSMARTTTFPALVALLAGQLGMGILIDRLGLFGMPAQPISLGRLVGLGFVLAGVLLARR